MGIPIFIIPGSSSLKHKSFLFMRTSFFLLIIIIESTTETAWAATVAMAAPAAFILNPAIKTRSPTMFTAQAIPTKSRGLFESPSPRKTALIKLYARIKTNPTPQILIY